MSEQSNGLLAFLSLSALLSIVPIRSLKFSITLTTSFQLYKTKNSSAIGTAIFNFTLYLGAESNCYQKFRKLLFYPLNYRGIFFATTKIVVIDEISKRSDNGHLCAHLQSTPLLRLFAIDESLLWGKRCQHHQLWHQSR